MHDFMEQPPRRKRRLTSSFQCMDEFFMSQPRRIPILDRFINYIDNKKLSEEDLKNNTNEIKKLLKYAFFNKKKPDEEHIKSVQTLFSQTSFTDFKRNLYKYSEPIATYLWVDRVQTIVTDPKEKNRILKAGTVNWNGYKLYCSLMGIDYVDKSKMDLEKDQNVQLFRNILRCSVEVLNRLVAFVNNHFTEDLSEEEKMDIAVCARKFL